MVSQVTVSHRQTGEGPLWFTVVKTTVTTQRRSRTDGMAGVPFLGTRRTEKEIVLSQEATLFKGQEKGIHASEGEVSLPYWRKVSLKAVIFYG